MNFSAFLARCIESGVSKRYEDRCKYAVIDIGKGIEKDLKPGITRDCRVMVASQYVLLAGRVVYEEIVAKMKGKDREKWGLDKWSLWGRKFKELAREYEEIGNPGLASATKQAYEKMVSFHPSLFSSPD